MQKRKTMRQRYQKVNNDISQRKYDSALKELNIILNHNDCDIFALTKKGHILLLKDDYYGALDCYNDILELFPSNLDALVGKSKALFGLKQYEDAFNVYNMSIELRENGVDVNFYNELFKFYEKGNMPLPIRKSSEVKKVSKTKSSSEKYIIFTNSYYRVHKRLNGKQRNFGSFEKVENACVLRDLLIENDWDKSKVSEKYFSDHSNSMGKHGKNIIFVNNYYKVHKTINGKRKSFGSFKDKKNAIILRDLLIENGWDKSKVSEKYFSDHSNSMGKHGKNIIFVNNYYKVHKTINGKRKSFGSFKDKKNAIILRDLLIENGWVESGIPKEFFSDHSSSNEGKYGKNILLSNGYFRVKKQIGGKNRVFGSFENVENAHRLRELLIRNDWNKSNIPQEFLNDHANSKREEKFGEYIRFNYNYYRVQKTIDGEERNFGSFKQGKNAVHLRNLLIANDWDETRINREFFSDYENPNRNKYARHISRINDKFKVNKTIGGKLKFFGSFKYLGNAVRLRDLLIEANWSESSIPEELFRDYSSSNQGGEYIILVNDLYKVHKLIDGKHRNFGSFKEKSNAIRLRDLLIENEWDDSNIPEQFFSDYEGYRKRNRYGKNISLINKYFRVYRLVEGKRKYFGSFVDVDNARRLRDLLIENDWDESKISNRFFADHKNTRIKK